MLAHLFLFCLIVFAGCSNIDFERLILCRTNLVLSAKKTGAQFGAPPPQQQQPFGGTSFRCWYRCRSIECSVAFDWLYIYIYCFWLRFCAFYVFVRFVFFSCLLAPPPQFGGTYKIVAKIFLKFVRVSGPPQQFGKRMFVDINTIVSSFILDASSSYMSSSQRRQQRLRRNSRSLVLVSYRYIEFYNHDWFCFPIDLDHR